MIATIIEISLAFPQIYNGWVSKSVRGLSITMIIVWLFSDAFKTAYFLYNVKQYLFRISQYNLL